MSADTITRPDISNEVAEDHAETCEGGRWRAFVLSDGTHVTRDRTFCAQPATHEVLARCDACKRSPRTVVCDEHTQSLIEQQLAVCSQCMRQCMPIVAVVPLH